VTFGAPSAQLPGATSGWHPSCRGGQVGSEAPQICLLARRHGVCSAAGMCCPSNDEHRGRPPERSLFKNQRGHLFVEYVVVAAFTGIVVAGGLTLFGPKIVKVYSERRNHLYAPTP
jgi:hypothetical protein